MFLKAWFLRKNLILYLKYKAVSKLEKTKMIILHPFMNTHIARLPQLDDWMKSTVRDIELVKLVSIYLSSLTSYNHYDLQLKTH